MIGYTLGRYIFGMESHIILARMIIGGIAGTAYGIYYSRDDTDMKLSASSLFCVGGIMACMTPALYPIIGIPYVIVLALQSL